MEIRVGSILDGNVKSITKFGAFVSLPGGRSGLVHISEIAHSYVNDVNDHLQLGQAVKVKVVSIDDAGRINFSIKKAQDPPPNAQGQPPRGPRPQHAAPRPAPARPTGNAAAQTPPARMPSASTLPPSQDGDFEHMMKQFMQTSDTKLSSLRMHEKRSSRRSGHH